MKKLLIVFASVAVLTACNNNPAADAMDKAAATAEKGMEKGGELLEDAEGALENAKEMGGEVADLAKKGMEIVAGGMTIDTEKSVVNWTGKKLTGEHTGTVKFQSGGVKMSDGGMSANFVVDMTTIENTDMAGDPDNKGKLEGHLKSPDFFGVEANPMANLMASNMGFEAESGRFKGDAKLTIKGITKGVAVNGIMKDNPEGGKVINARFELNRADFDVKYGSKTFFESIGDKIIYDEVPVSVTIYCN